jgi:hydrogenase expression/formation protein HypC
MCLAVPAKIESIDKTSAIVDFGGTKRKISLGVLSGVKKGDHVLVHAGFAIGKVSISEALDTLKVLDELKAVIREDIKKRR